MNTIITVIIIIAGVMWLGLLFGSFFSKIIGSILRLKKRRGSS